MELCPALEAPAFVADLDGLAVMGETVEDLFAAMTSVEIGIAVAATIAPMRMKAASGSENLRKTELSRKSATG